MVVSSAWAAVAMARPTRPDSSSFFMTLSSDFVKVTFSGGWLAGRPDPWRCSSLQPTDREPLNEAPLGEQKADDHGRHDDDRRSHQGTDIGAGFLVAKIEDAPGRRRECGVADRDQRPEE